MTTTITSQDLTQDSIKESFTKLAEKAFSGAATYMNTLADSLFTQAATTEARAALFQQQLANLDTVAAHVMDEMKAINSSALDTAIVTRYNSLMTDLGKAEAFISSAKQAASIGSNLEGFGNCALRRAWHAA